MSAAANAAGYLYASGRLRGVHGRELGQDTTPKSRSQRDAERAAEDLKREREAKPESQRRKT